MFQLSDELDDRWVFQELTEKKINKNLKKSFYEVIKKKNVSNEKKKIVELHEKFRCVIF